MWIRKTERYIFMRNGWMHQMKFSKIKWEKFKFEKKIFVREKRYSWQKIKHSRETIKLSWTKWHFHDNSLEPRVTYFCVVSGQGEYGLLHHLGLHGPLAQLVDVLLLGCGLPTDVPRLLRGPHGYCVSFLKVQDQIEFGNPIFTVAPKQILYSITSKCGTFFQCAFLFTVCLVQFFSVHFSPK